MEAYVMASLRLTNNTQLLFFDFRHQGQRCREYTALPDTNANRKRLGKILAQIESEITAGTFQYERYFPNSKMAGKFEQAPASRTRLGQQVNRTQPVMTPIAATLQVTPFFSAFADEWFAENEVRWRNSYRQTIADILRIYLKYEFGERAVGQISKADILKFRSSLAKVQTRKNQRELSTSRINYIMMALRQILTEAADRFDYTNPYRSIKPLKVKKLDVHPFSIEEVQQILTNVRKDFRNYYTVRFFTGMRTGEIDGLKWEYIDFVHRLILVRETVVRGEEEYTKTDSSQRDIQMSQLVYDALKAQEAATYGISKFVFSNAERKALEHNNVSKRVWFGHKHAEFLCCPGPSFHWDSHPGGKIYSSGKYWIPE
jgi:integrase